jgi:4-carboxymuconolactone decarboxylase
MANLTNIGHQLFGDIAPQLADFNDRVLFSELWPEPTLSQRDRSLITISNLVSMYRTNELPFHIKRAWRTGSRRKRLLV